MFNFPWTNFHELNLDWILSVVKEAKEVFDDGRSDIDYAVSTADEAKNIATQAAQATIPDNSVSTAKIQDYAVNADKISNYSVTEAKLQNAAVSTAKLADNAVTWAKLASNVQNTIVDKADRKIITSGSINDITESGLFYCVNAVTDAPIAGGGCLVQIAYNNLLAAALYIASANGTLYSGFKLNGVWSWSKITLETETITGTTTSTGALILPSRLHGKLCVGAYMTDNLGFVYQRDGSYLTCFNNALSAPIAETAVTIKAVFI